MSVRDLIPWGRNDPIPSRFAERDPFMSLHREMNRLFDDAFRNFSTPLVSREGGGWPSLEVSETEKEIKVCAELPGMDQKDVNVTLSNGMLTIRGEKKSESKDEERRFSERYYGSFERRIALDGEVNEDAVKASFSNGLLTVTIPKSERAQQSVKSIPINGG